MSDTTPNSMNARSADLSRNPNIADLSVMLRQASSMTEPSTMLEHFGPWIARRAPRDAFISVSRRGLPDGQYKFTRVMSFTGGTPDPSDELPDPWSTWDSIETYSGGLIWDIISTPNPKLLNHVDLTTDPVLSAVLGPNAKNLGSIAAIPSYERGESINWAISFQKDPAWDDLETFENGFLDLNMLGTATRNLVSRKKVEELNAELEKQFEEMGQIQRALIPASNPTLDGYSLATSYQPSQQAGGDFYDYFQYPDGRLGVMIADVAGHGAAAATVMAMLGAYIRAYGESLSPDEMQTDPVGAALYLNRHLIESALPNMFVTAFIAILDPKTGTIHWTRCGHNPPRIRGVDGTIRSLLNPGTLPLGITKDLPALSLSSKLAPGETLVLFTDGITEASRPVGNEAGFEMFGEDRLDQALTKCSGQPECVIESINTALIEFTGSTERKDDQTILVVRHNHPDDPS